MLCLFSFPDNSDNSNYELCFPSKTVSDYVRIDLPSSVSPLTAFTVCLWIKVGDRSSDGTLFSYSVPGMSNEIVVDKYSMLRLRINNVRR